MADNDYPELEKLNAVRPQMEAIRNFLQWAGEENAMELARFSDEEYASGRYYPVHRSIDDLLYEHFGINAKRIEQERRAMLEALAG